MALPPGYLQPVRNLGRLARDPLGFLVGAAERHGDIVYLPTAPRPIQRRFVLVSAPEHVRHVLQVNDANYRKAFTYEPLRRFLGEGLLTSEGDRWRQHRRIAQPFFRTAVLNNLTPTFAAGCERLLQRWSSIGSETVIDVGFEMRRLTLDIVGRTLVGMDLSTSASSVGTAIELLQEMAFRQVMTPRTWLGWTWLPQRTPRRHAQAIEGIDRIVGDLIEQRRQNPQEYEDLLAGLLQAADAEGTTLTHAELRDQLVTFLAAGHETTANALAWTWYLLGRNPEVRRRLVAEVNDLLPEGQTPTAEDVEKLTFTQAVLNESMRLYPPAWTIERDAVTDDIIGGYDIPAGTTVMTSPYVLHRRSTLWDDPLAFDPDRFLDSRADERERLAFLPFGAGRRQCIGASFAMLEGTLALALLARRFHLALVPDQTVVAEPRITLGMRRPLRARLVPSA